MRRSRQVTLNETHEDQPDLSEGSVVTSLVVLRLMPVGFDVFAEPFKRSARDDQLTVGERPLKARFHQHILKSRQRKSLFQNVSFLYNRQSQQCITEKRMCEDNTATIDRSHR